MIPPHRLIVFVLVGNHHHIRQVSRGLISYKDVGSNFRGPSNCIIARFLTFIVMFLHMKSFMGPAEVAAWGILGYLWEVFEYMTGKKSISTFALD